MSTFRPPESFAPGTSPAESWEAWKQRFEIFFEAADLTSKPIAQQRAILLNIVGEIGLQIYNTLPINEQDDARTVRVILEAFSAYFRPHKNTTYKRYIFFSTVQSQENSIDEFVTDLKIKAKDCEFGDLSDSLIRDKLVCGLREVNLRERLLREPNLTLALAVDICRADEASKQQTKSIATGQPLALHAFYKPKVPMKNKPDAPKPKQKAYGSSQEQERKTCSRCGTSHKFRECPAYNQHCKKCKKKGHFARVCRGTQVNTLVENLNLESEEELFLGSIVVGQVTDGSPRDEWIEEIEINNRKVRIKIDTGSQANILPLHVYEKLDPVPNLVPTKRIVTAYTGHCLPLVGICAVPCTMSGVTKLCDFYVTEIKGPPIMGLKSIEQWNLISRVSVIEESPSLHSAQAIVDEYSDVFEGLGKIPGKHHIRISEGAIPRVYAPRKIPYALRSKVKMELDAMLKKGIIEKVTEPTEWVHPIVVVNKPDGSVRICMDPRELNKVIQREHYQLPTPEDIFHKLNGCQYFTVLDASTAFWQIELDEESSRLCTFATPFGRYRFCRLPYGIKSAPEVFQRAMCEMYYDIDGPEPYFDDIIVAGVTEREHNANLKAVLERARRDNLKLGKKKMQLAKREIDVLGSTVSSQGISISEKRIQAISNMENPADKKSLQRFLGIINYLSKFIPNQAEKTGYLRNMLKDNTAWLWDSMAEDAFNILKATITAAPVLAFFDSKERITLSVDASQYGLGAVLLQNNRPIAFASATLNPTQQRYAQIEKELLAIVYACEHFHVFTYGSEITIQTDHKPLLAIVKKSLNDLTPRIQRLMMRLLRYNFELVHVPGKEMYISDALSRSPENALVNTDYLEGKACKIHLLLAVTPQKFQSIQESTSSDPVLQQLSKYIRNGWPDHRSAVHELALPFWPYKQDISEAEGLIYRNQRLILPKSQREEALARIHSAHQGVVACKNRAREVLYWPGMSKEIQQLVLSCKTCQQYSRKNTPEPLRQHPVPSRPWEKVGADFMALGSNHYLLLIDYFSKYVEVQILQRTSAYPVITAMKSIFARHGIAMEVITDNGPPFDSNAFRDFANEWDFTHVTSSPYYPKSNGMVERAIQTVKGLLAKAIAEKTDPYKVLLELRATPSREIPSPAEVLMGRKIRTFLPSTESLLQPQYKTGETRKQLELRQHLQKKYADRVSKPLEPLQVGQPVTYMKENRNWQPASVTQVGPEPRSYVIETPTGACYRRNRHHLRPSPNSDKSSTDLDEKIESQVQPPDKPDNNISACESNPSATLSGERSPKKTTRSGRIIIKPARFID